MTPREIDALVADKIMGWREETDKNRSKMGKPPMTDDEWVDMIDDSMNYFSSDIRAAWKVVEKILDKQKRQGVVNICFDHDFGWGALLVMTDEKMEWVHAETAPMAICLAALKAKGVAVKTEL